MGDGELPCLTNFGRRLTRIDRSVYDLVAMAPGQFLGEHHENLSFIDRFDARDSSMYEFTLAIPIVPTVLMPMRSP